MEYLITESQLKIILLEQDRDQLTSDMKTLNSFTEKIVNNVKKNYDLNLRLLLTWGASVGGLVMPLDNFIRTGNFNLSEKEMSLILVGVASTLLFENKKFIFSILSKIKESGIQDSYEKVLSKGFDLKKSFKGFLNSCNITTNILLDIMSYSFLIPIITDIYSQSIDAKNISEVSKFITERLIASGVIIIGKEILSIAIKKIIKKLK